MWRGGLRHSSRCRPTHRQGPGLRSQNRQPLPEESFLMAAVRRMLEARERDSSAPPSRGRGRGHDCRMDRPQAPLGTASARNRWQNRGVFPGPDFGFTFSEMASPSVNRFKTKRIMSIKMNNTSQV